MPMKDSGWIKGGEQPRAEVRTKDTLDQRIRQHGVVHIIRSSYDEGNIFGYPMQKSEKLVLVHQVARGGPSRLVILKREDIEDVYHTQSDSGLEDLFRREMPYTLLPPNYDLRSWQTLCAELAGKKNVVHIMDEQNKHSARGRILKAGENTVTVRCMDRSVQGERGWIASFRYEDITRVDMPLQYFYNFMPQ